jgi:hypothetical protein
MVPFTGELALRTPTSQEHVAEPAEGFMPAEDMLVSSLKFDSKITMVIFDSVEVNISVLSKCVKSYLFCRYKKLCVFVKRYEPHVVRSML